MGSARRATGLTAALAAVSLLVLTACTGARADAASDDRPVVLTTFTVLADIARNVAGDHLRVESVTKVGAEIHGYEPTPGDIRRASHTDLMLDNGLHLEQWFAQFVEELDVPHVVASDGVEAIPIVGAHRSGQEGSGPVNPHAWMSPLAVQVYVENMVAAFSRLDPGNAADYRANGTAYQTQLQQVHDELVDRLAVLTAGQRALVTCEGAFSYLARDTGLTERYLWAVNAEQQPTPRTIADLITFVEENHVPAVFCESTVSDASMQQVVQATGTAFGGTLYVDSLSGPDGPVPTYLDLVRHDTGVIVDALTAGAS